MLRNAQIHIEFLTENIFKTYCIFEIKMQYIGENAPYWKAAIIPLNYLDFLNSLIFRH